MLEDAPALIKKLTASKQTLTTVESCTGGLLFGYVHLENYLNTVEIYRLQSTIFSIFSFNGSGRNDLI